MSDARQRRWQDRSAYRLSNGHIEARILAGVKSPDDLVVELRTQGLVRPGMDLVFFLADFFHENEQWLEPHRPHWRRPGGDYFLEHLKAAVMHGWEPVAREVERQRQARER